MAITSPPWASPSAQDASSPPPIHAAPRRAPAWIGRIVSLIAVLLIAVGTYGVLSYAVAQRRREIGVRMALGARPEQIRRQFLALALRLLAGGTLLGSIGAWLAGRAMRTMLF